MFALRKRSVMTRMTAIAKYGAAETLNSQWLRTTSISLQSVFATTVALRGKSSISQFPEDGVQFYNIDPFLRHSNLDSAIQDDKHYLPYSAGFNNCLAT